MLRLLLPAVVCLVATIGCQERERTLEDVPFTPPIRVDTAGSASDTQVQRDTNAALDTLVEEDLAVADAFATFLQEFQAAVRADDPASVSSLVRFREGGLDANAFEETIFPIVFRGEMGDRFLDVEPSDVERSGTQRRITLHVGYDREGNVVPPEEAYTEAAATLTFDQTAEGYRLVRVETTQPSP